MSEHVPACGKWGMNSLLCFACACSSLSPIKLSSTQPMRFHIFTLQILSSISLLGSKQMALGGLTATDIKPQCWLILFLWYSRTGFPRCKKSTCQIHGKAHFQIHSLTVLLVQTKRRVATVEYQLVFDRPNNKRQRHQQGYIDPVQLQSSPARERQRHWLTGRWRCTYGTGFLLHKKQKYTEHLDTI